jgi:hypothetical protein
LKIMFTVAVLLAFCLFANAAYVLLSSGSGKFQEVGGDFGKSWISNFQAQNPKLNTQTNNSTLWGWGSVPKGKELVGDKLVDANKTWLYNATNWMGDNYVDPYSGNYIDPNTGQPVYRNLQVFPPTTTTNPNSNPTTNNQPGSQLPKILQSLSTGS